MTKSFCKVCGRLPCQKECPVGIEHEARIKAEETIKIIAVMLGWGNVPPRETLEMDIRSKRAAYDHERTRAENAERERDSLRAHLAAKDAEVERVRKSNDAALADAYACEQKARAEAAALREEGKALREAGGKARAVFGLTFDPPETATHECGGICADFHCSACGQPADDARPVSMGPALHADCRASLIDALASAPDTATLPVPPAGHDASEHDRCAPDECDFAGMVAQGFPRDTANPNGEAANVLEWAAQFFITQNRSDEPLTSKEVAEDLRMLAAMKPPRIYRVEDCTPHTASATPAPAKPAAELVVCDNDDRPHPPDHGFGGAPKCTNPRPAKLADDLHAQQSTTVNAPSMLQRIVSHAAGALEREEARLSECASSSQIGEYARDLFRLLIVEVIRDRNILTSMQKSSATTNGGVV
jgi:hypothetical protein